LLTKLIKFLHQVSICLLTNNHNSYSETLLLRTLVEHTHFVFVG